MLAPTSFLTRLAVAGRVFWFYLGKALVPVNLNLVYPVWRTDTGTLAAWLPLLLAVAGLALCWRFRRSWGRPGLLLFIGFGLALFPSLGLFDAQFLTRWQVSDHLQYLPLIVPVALLAAVVTGESGRRHFPAAAPLLLAFMFVLTFQRAAAFATEEALMRDTLAKNPAAADAHNDLGSILARRGALPAAQAEFDAAFQANPADANIRLNLAQAMALQGRLEEAEAHYAAALKLHPGEPQIHRQFARLLADEGKFRQALVHWQAAIIFQKRGQPDADTRIQLATLYQQTGHPRRAAAQLRLALQARPDSVEILNNLAWILATSPNPRARDGTEAVHYAELACQLSKHQSATPMSTLAAAYAEAGRFPEAMTTAARAMQIQNSTGDARMAAINRQLLAYYQAGQPFHESGAAEADAD